MTLVHANAMMMKAIILKQRGVMLLEALIGLLIFSLGVLALVGMQAAALRGVSDARYRTQASDFANQLLQKITLNATRDASTTNINQASITNFAYSADGTDCGSFSGDTSNTLVSDWASQVAHTLPGDTMPDGTPKPKMQQVVINQPDSSTNQVTITVCWQTPDDAVPRKHILTSYIN